MAEPNKVADRPKMSLEEEKRTRDSLAYCMNDWKKYVFETLYKAHFDIGDAQDGFKGEAHRAGGIIDLQIKLGERRSLDEIRRGWAAEVERNLSEGEWQADDHEEFVKKYCSDEHGVSGNRT